MKTSRIFFASAFTIFLISGISFQHATAQAKPAAHAAAEFRRLVDLQKALTKIPMEKQNREPHKSFLKRNAKKIVYSDPSAEYYVKSELFWDLRAKYKDLPIADDIAWAAASNTLPGECEGFLTCYLYVIRQTNIEYLRIYPNGKYSKKALQQVIDGLVSTVADLGKNEGHTGPTDAADKADLAKSIAEMRTIVSKVPHPGKAKLLQQLKQIADAYK